MVVVVVAAVVAVAATVFANVSVVAAVIVVVAVVVVVVGGRSIRLLLQPALPNRSGGTRRLRCTLLNAMHPLDASRANHTTSPRLSASSIVRSTSGVTSA